MKTGNGICAVSRFRFPKIMSLFKKKAPVEQRPDLTALRLREQELVAQQRALEAQHLDCEDIDRSNELLEEINALNARIGVVRDKIGEFPG